MTITRREVEKLEKVVGQIDGLSKEMSSLARKSPNDGVNEFKLKFINALLVESDKVLGERYKPFADFQAFDFDDLPSNSDVTFIIGQYIEELERKRADNIRSDGIGGWVYDLRSSEEEITTGPPKKLREK